MGLGKELLAVAALWASLMFCEGITGGSEAVAHSRPYMASIQRDGVHECGGFLVADRWVMSAAHCFQTGFDGLRVVLGAHSLSQPEPSKQNLAIEAVHSHQDFSISNYDNDIALIKLTQSAALNDQVATVKFQREGGAEPETGVTVSTAGWGSEILGSRPDKLQEVDVTVIASKLCARSDYYGRKFTGNMMCAAETRKDTCDGDSGGPLLYKGVVVGITSNGGKKCGSFRKPGIYTIISHYSSWIDRYMQQ